MHCCVASKKLKLYTRWGTIAFDLRERISPAEGLRPFLPFELIVH